MLLLPCCPATPTAIAASQDGETQCLVVSLGLDAETGAEIECHGRLYVSDEAGLGPSIRSHSGRRLTAGSDRRLASFARQRKVITDIRPGRFGAGWRGGWQRREQEKRGRRRGTRRRCCRCCVLVSRSSAVVISRTINPLVLLGFCCGLLSRNGCQQISACASARASASGLLRCVRVCVWAGRLAGWREERERRGRAF